MEALSKGKITPKDITNIMQRGIKSDIERGMGTFTFPEGMKVWKKATDEEKADMQPILMKKWYSWNATDEEKESVPKTV